MAAGTVAPTALRSGRACAVRWRERGVIILFLLPWIVGFLAFVAFPMATSLYHSFTSYDVLSPPRWVGLENYRYLLTKDPMFWLSIRNTLWMIVFALPVQLGFALGTAVLLARPRRGSSIYRTIFYLPSLVPPVAATLAFAYLLDPGTGPLNDALDGLGAPEPLWFYDPRFAKPGLALLALWGVGPTAVVFLTGMLRVPCELYDLAATEGASRFQRFRHVTLPMISPLLLFSVVIGVIGALQQFTQAYIASSVVSNAFTPVLGAPQGSTLFYSVWLHRQAFGSFDMGYASALAWVLVVISLASVALVLRGSVRWVHYRGGA